VSASSAGPSGVCIRLNNGEQVLDKVQKIAPVPVRHGKQLFAGLVTDRQRPAFQVFGPLQQTCKRLPVKPVERQHLGARQHGGIELEGRVFRGGAHQRDGAVLHPRQEAVLLRLVEPVDFVHEKQRALPLLIAPQLGRLEHLLQVSHARVDRADLLEVKPCLARQQPGNGGLAGAGRPPQDHRRDPARGNHPADQPFGPVR
jgi:hypothetical protein